MSEESPEIGADQGDGGMAPSSIEPEPPYGTILSELEGGYAIPFLGAGSSRIAAPGEGPQPPSGAELASLLAQAARFPSNDELERGDLAKVSSYFEEGSNRGALRRKLRDVFLTKSFAPNSLHALLANVAKNMVIVTTNYDTLLEQAFAAAGKPYDVAVYSGGNGVFWWHHGESSPRLYKANELDPKDIGRTNLIYKVHGTLQAGSDKWDRFVITEEDYIQFLSKMNTAVPPAFSTFFRDRAFLFLGYGLRDWNMRVLLKQVRSPEVRSWAIQHNPSVLERKLWERRGVDIYNLSLEKFVRNLCNSDAGSP